MTISNAENGLTTSEYLKFIKKTAIPFKAITESSNSNINLIQRDAHTHVFNLDKKNTNIKIKWVVRTNFTQMTSFVNILNKKKGRRYKNTKFKIERRPATEI